MKQIWTGLIAALLLILPACKVNHLADAAFTNVAISDEQASKRQASIDSLVAPYKARLDAEMDEVIGEAVVELRKMRPESRLGNWFADLLHEETEKHLGKPIDFAIMNYGGIRIPSIPSGPITRRIIYELMPFDNLITVVYLDAGTLLEFIKHMAKGGGWPASAQLRYNIKDGEPQQITIDGNPIDPTRTYAVSISDYLANGGGGCDFFAEMRRDDLGILVRQATIDHIIEDTRLGQKQNAELEGRIRYHDDP
ncbi:MAG: 5'-nucleotidase C-terminal domain-containing protein [Saprospiraceae bacterium]|nr:5'-nucleotidase C-terminal domain-containing protein [Saprospiraceae bacterium]